VVYQGLDAELIVIVAFIGHRRDVYRGLLAPVSCGSRVRGDWPMADVEFALARLLVAQREQALTLEALMQVGAAAPRPAEQVGPRPYKRATVAALIDCSTNYARKHSPLSGIRPVRIGGLNRYPGGRCGPLAT
jgi:hypothetical protein